MSEPVTPQTDLDLPSPHEVQPPDWGDAFIIDQPFTLWVNEYTVSTANPEGFVPGTRLVSCRQKVFAWKEDIRFFADEGEAREAFRIKARRAIDIGGRYDLTDADGIPIGALERRARASLLRTTWQVITRDERVVVVIRERSKIIAAVRRIQNLLQFIPLVGWILDLLFDLIPIPYHFDLTDPAGHPLGTHTRKLGFRDRYRLDITGDPDREIDRRLLVAAAVGLDALQSR